MSEIKAAMTKAEWKEWTDNMSWYMDQGATRAEGIEEMAPSTGGLHQLAAKCLHGQPFGFTWEDVDVLLKVVREASHIEVGADEKDGLHGIADRIKALLPPEKP